METELMKAIARLERWLFNPDHGGPTASALPRLTAGGTSCPEGACNDQMSSDLSDGLLNPCAAASVSPTTGPRSWATTLRGGLARALQRGRPERTWRVAHDGHDSGAEHASMEDAKRGRRQIGVRDTDLAVSARVLSEHRAVLAVRGRLNASPR